MRPQARAFTPSLHQHTLSETDFDTISAGHGEDELLGRLRRAETSYRHTMLRALLDALRKAPDARGPLLAPDTAWDLLVQIERHSPQVTAALLDRPQVGAWAAHLLRRLLGTIHDDSPLWVDAGHLHTLAAAAAVRAGVDCVVPVPMRHGIVHLPTLGHAVLPFHDPWAVAQVRHSAAQNQTTVTSDNGSVSFTRTANIECADWRPHRSLTVNAASQTLTVSLEDADPYRLIGTVARPSQLSASDIRRWQGLLKGAWELLVEGHQAHATELSQTLVTVAPLPKASVFRPRSASSGDAFGGAVLSEPDDAVQLAASLIHELAHFKLGVLMHLFDLHDPDRLRLGYAPWRDDPRPTRGVLHGIYAFTAVTGFWRKQRLLSRGSDARLAHFEFAFWRRQAYDTASRLRAGGDLTPLGMRFLDGVLTVLEPWCTEPVPAEATSFSRFLILDHRAQWRAHHLHPPATQIHNLAATWLAGQAPNPGDLPSADSAVLVPDQKVRHLDGRACLARLWLGKKDEFRRIPDSDPRTVVPGTTTADYALISQDKEQARRRYVSLLEDDPTSISALVGLGLADRDLEALVMRPELVTAVSREVTTETGQQPRLEAIAAWLTPVLVSTRRNADGYSDITAAPQSTQPGGEWSLTG